MPRKKKVKEPFAGLIKESGNSKAVEPIDENAYDPYVARIHGLNPDSTREYILVVTQAGPFSSRNLIFMVHKVTVTDPDSPSATVNAVDEDGDLLVSFPVGFPYLLFRKDQCDMVKLSTTQEDGPAPKQGSGGSFGQYL